MLPTIHRRAFICALPLIAGTGLLARDADITGILEHPSMSPARCAVNDPDFMWQNRDTTIPVSWTEQGQDQFFQAYAENLRQWTDEKYPKAREVRPHIAKAFSAAMELIVLGAWGGVAHVLTRLPAKVEWIVWNGFNRSFEESAKYRQEDIRTLLTILFQANAESWKKLGDLPGIDDTLGALFKAEKLLPQPGCCYFRSQLVKMIGQQF
jgi:hypothetical protein